MKLMTEVSGNDDDVILVCNGDIDMSADDQMEHDAAAAHAMMQAMDWVSSNGIGCDPYEVPDFIRERAEEIMREWGYTEGSN